MVFRLFYQRFKYGNTGGLDKLVYGSEQNTKLCPCQSLRCSAAMPKELKNSHKNWFLKVEEKIYQRIAFHPKNSLEAEEKMTTKYLRSEAAKPKESGVEEFAKELLSRYSTILGS